MKNDQTNSNRKICSSLKSILILSLISLLTSTSPAFAEFVIDKAQQVTVGQPRRNPIHSVASDNEDHDFIAWVDATNPYGEYSIKVKTYLDGRPIGDDVAVDQTLTHDFGIPALCVAQKGTLYLVWKKWLRGQPAAMDFYFSGSFDYGTSWSKPIRINPQESYSNVYGKESLRCNDQGAVYVGWAGRDTAATRPQQIYFNRSLDYGATWLSQEIQISNATHYSAMSMNSPFLALGRDGFVYIAWIERVVFQAPDHIYLKRSTDYGETWPKTATQIDHNPGYAGVWLEYPAQIAADSNGNVYMAWTEASRDGNRVVVSLNRSHDDGETWQDEDQIISGSSGYGRLVSSDYLGLKLLSTDNKGHVYIVFFWHPEKYESLSVAFNSSADFGVTWEKEPTIIMDRGGQLASPPTMCADQNGKIYVVMGKDGQSWLQRHMYTNVSEDYGRTWVYGGEGGQVDSADPKAEGNAAIGLISCNQNGRSAMVWREGEYFTGYHLYYNTGRFKA